MNNLVRLEIFRAQTENVKLLKKAEEQISRTIKDAMRRGDETSSEVQTKVLALVFCAWAEANFSKLIHTPHGFTLDEIHQIKQAQQQNLEAGWKKCIELGLKKIPSSSKSSFIPNTKQKINKLVDDYIINPSLIRNKVAHGQWKIALNKSNTAVNNDITKELKALDLVVITKWFKINRYLSNIIENLIESPKKAFQREYWSELTKLYDFLDKSKNWDIETKIQLLQLNPITYKAPLLDSAAQVHK
jgi:hypothetical protein